MASSVAKTLARIRGSVEAGAYYEAQQMYKTSYHRSKARKQLSDAIQILQEGAVTQLSYGQTTCGVELGMLLVETYTSTDTPADEASVARLLAIIHAFPPPSRAGGEAAAGSAAGQGSAAAVVDECARLVATAVKWALKCGAAAGARSMHSAFAAYLWKSLGAEGFGRALQHFVRSDDAQTFAEALHSCAQSGPAAEVDLWLLRALLQVLAAASSPSSRAAQLAHARAVSRAFCQLSGPLDTPTSHFAELLLLALEHAGQSPRAHAMFQLARERYSDEVLRRDESLGPMLERVEVGFFNVRRGNGALGGLLGDLFKSLTEAH
ncbi:hypothetical protein Agub_g13243 [Astrephomene gubernaculifera]|uniref:Golgi to ER traffic protein 4 n=1 Tax=Astrephomene gubernaculifera TaxID=47775 RepID=A0AAD3DZK9_9CHLO|nr:hypothetical protein Agub_g13243 [Astrephomene gubernaculifera]